ncbi:MAG: hypothetical protein HC907_22080 [Richelia sp. SM1_7_0]|nr:hypothetical protein [Richelia sp. SM1_7_0]
MIDSKLNELAKRLQAKLKYKNSNFSFSLSQIRDEISKVSTDYANITSNQENLIMDKLINKSQSSIEIKSQCDLTETEDNTTANESNTNNDQGVNDMKEANTNNQSSLTVNNQQSSAITFNDDLDKAIEVRSLAATQNIQLSGKEALEVAQNVGNKFNSSLELLHAIVKELSIRQNKSDNEMLIKISDTLINSEENTAKAGVRGLELVKNHIQRTAKIKSDGVQEIKNTFEEFWRVTGM